MLSAVRSSFLKCLVAAPVIGFTCASGCGSIESLTDGNRNPFVAAPLNRSSGEPNDRFSDATVVPYDLFGVARLQGEITDDRDVDVFDIGPLEPGERIIVDARAVPGTDSLDIAVALFDARHDLFVENDDTQDSLDALIDEPVRSASERYFLVVSRSLLADDDRMTGRYTVDVTVRGEDDVAQPRKQVIFLDFDGGEVSADNLGVPIAEPFDAARIHERYADDTELIKSLIVERFKHGFRHLNVIVVTSDQVDEPRTEHSVVFFGGMHPPGLSAFGAAEHIDSMNRDPRDVALIFTEVFSPYLFSTAPTSEELAFAIANVAVHEAGHLLGMTHVDDPTALMDGVSPADTFLFDQQFKRAPLLVPAFFPSSFQDAALRLAEILGASDSLANSKQVAHNVAERVLDDAEEPTDGVSWLRDSRVRVSQPRKCYTHFGGAGVP